MSPRGFWRHLSICVLHMKKDSFYSQKTGWKAVKLGAQKHIWVFTHSSVSCCVYASVLFSFFSFFIKHAFVKGAQPAMFFTHSDRLFQLKDTVTRRCSSSSKVLGDGFYFCVLRSHNSLQNIKRFWGFFLVCTMLNIHTKSAALHFIQCMLDLLAGNSTNNCHVVSV